MPLTCALLGADLQSVPRFRCYGNIYNTVGWAAMQTRIDQRDAIWTTLSKVYYNPFTIFLTSIQVQQKLAPNAKCERMLVHTLLNAF